MKQPPTDVDIVAAIRKWGNRATTSMVRSVLVQQFDMLSISTPWVLRQLKRLEREGKVQEVDSRVYKTQYVWSALQPHDPGRPVPHHGSGPDNQ